MTFVPRIGTVHNAVLTVKLYRGNTAVIVQQVGSELSSTFGFVC